MRSNLNRKLWASRAFVGKSQYDISRETGVHQSRISLIEGGYVKPRTEEAKAIAEALGEKPEILFPEN